MSRTSLKLRMVVLIGLFASQNVSGKERFKCSLNYSSEANLKFSVILLQKVMNSENHNSNVLLSPMAVGSGLSMLVEAAVGVTKRQIVRGLQLDKSDEYSDERIPCFLRLYRQRTYATPASNRRKIKKSNFEPTTFTKATKLYGERSVNFKNTFLRRSSVYGTRLEKVNFRQKPDEARRKINVWVSRHSAMKINNFLRPGAIRKSTNLALVTTVYFKGTWEKLFMEYDTRQDDFFISKGNTIKAQFMENLGFYRTLKLTSPAASLLELPYKATSGSGIDASMILIMPSNSTDMADVLLQLLEKQNEGHNEVIQQLLSRRKSYYNILIPKYNVSTHHDLQTALRRMGIRSIFHWKNADFSSMTQETLTPTFLNSVTHKTVMSISERGTEVSSATAFRFGLIAEPPVLKFNQPFFVIILEKITNSILFIGRISNPSYSDV